MVRRNSPALASKAKAMYGNRLRKDDYEELLRKKTVGEIATYLKNETDYESSLKNVYENRIHRGQLENLINTHIFKKILKLLKFSQLTKDEFYMSNIIHEEVDVILSALRSLVPEKFEDLESNVYVQEIPFYLSDYISFSLEKMVGLKDYQQLLKALEKTHYYDILKQHEPKGEEKIDYTVIERELTSHYYKHIFSVIDRTFKGSQKKKLNDIYSTQIELSNITKIYRFKKFFKVTNEEIRNSMLMVNSRISSAKLDELIALPTAEDVLKALENSRYQIYSDDQDYVFIEYYAEKIQYNLAKRYMHFSIDTPLIFTSYVILLQTEVQNLTNIIEGIRYDIPMSDIEKMLIY